MGRRELHPGLKTVTVLKQSRVQPHGSWVTGPASRVTASGHGFWSEEEVMSTVPRDRIGKIVEEWIEQAMSAKVMLVKVSLVGLTDLKCSEGA